MRAMPRSRDVGLGLRQMRFNKQPPRPLAKPLNLVTSHARAGRGQGADVGRSQVVEAVASAVAESTGHWAKAGKVHVCCVLLC